MSTVQEKRSMSKTNFFMMKYERTKGYVQVASPDFITNIFLFLFTDNVMTALKA